MGTSPTTCAACTGAFDVAAACAACMIANTCPSCNACQSANTASCANYNNCMRCTACNTRCDTCQGLCETRGQTFTAACGNAFPGDRWVDVVQGGSIIQTFPQGKFYWAWAWLRNAINYGAQQNSPGASNPPTPKEFLLADHWNQLNTVMESIKAGNAWTNVAAHEKVTAALVTTAGDRLRNVRINRRACHFQNTVWASCGPTSSECCQQCEGCMVCTAQNPVICTHYGCQSCQTCNACVTCQNCNSCQSCNTCQGACNTCNNCNVEQTG